MVVSITGVRDRLQRPMDFLVFADHAENLGLAPMIAEKNPDLLKTEFGKKISSLVYDGKYLGAYALRGEGMEVREDPLKGNDALTRTVWERITTSVEKFNEPGKFTALIGLEWTSSPGGNNLHCNVIFCDDDDRPINEKKRCDKPVGNTVDIDNATYINSIGDALVMAYWKDPAFDPGQRAFY